MNKLITRSRSRPIGGGPSWLRTHPPTEGRVQRLLDIEAKTVQHPAAYHAILTHGRDVICHIAFHNQKRHPISSSGASTNPGLWCVTTSLGPLRSPRPVASECWPPSCFILVWLLVSIRLYPC